MSTLACLTCGIIISKRFICNTMLHSNENVASTMYIHRLTFSQSVQEMLLTLCHFLVEHLFLTNLTRMLSVKRKTMLTTIENSYIEAKPGIDSIMFFCQLVS
jgi:hypothetical protein